MRKNLDPDPYKTVPVYGSETLIGLNTIRTQSCVRLSRNRQPSEKGNSPIPPTSIDPFVEKLKQKPGRTVRIMIKQVD